jgi:hypothetical protein
MNKGGFSATLRRLRQKYSCSRPLFLAQSMDVFHVLVTFQYGRNESYFSFVNQRDLIWDCEKSKLVNGSVKLIGIVARDDLIVRRWSWRRRRVVLPS